MQQLYWDTVKVNGEKIYFTLDKHGVNFVSTPKHGVSQVLDFYTGSKFEFVRNHEFSENYLKGIKAYLKGKSQELDFPVDFMDYGSDQERLVWSSITQLPYGKTVTVEELADELSLGQNDVERALAESPVWLFLPLQRVVGRNGRYPYRVSDEMREYLCDVEKHPKRVRRALKKEK